MSQSMPPSEPSKDAGASSPNPPPIPPLQTPAHDKYSGAGEEAAAVFRWINKTNSGCVFAQTFTGDPQSWGWKSAVIRQPAHQIDVQEINDLLDAAAAS